MAGPLGRLLGGVTTLGQGFAGYSSQYNRVRPTLAGAWFLAIVLGVLVAALNTGNNLVYLVLAALLCLLVVNNLLAEWNLRGLEVSRVLPAELYAGAPAEGQLVVENRRRWGDAFAVEVEEQDGGRARAVVPHVRALASTAVPATWRFEGRGTRSMSSVRVGSAYPFGLLRRYRDLPVPDEVLVYPHPERDVPPTAAAGDGPGAASRGGADATGELLGLRAYQPGDPVRRVHWPTSARVGVPMVTLRAGEHGSEAFVTVDERLAGAARERAIARAAGRVLWHCERGDAVGLEADGQRIGVATGAAHRRRLLTTLALLPERGAP